MQDIQALFEAVREACGAGLWSQGVSLTRGSTIVGLRADEESVELELSPPGELKSFHISLYPEDEDWTCTCKSGDDACAHVAAAVIALRQARREGKALPKAPAVATLRYHFRRSAQGNTLLFGRAFVLEKEETPVTATLSAIRSGRIAGPQFLATESDLALDHIIGVNLNTIPSRETFPRLARPLSQCSDLMLDGEPIQVSTESVGMQIVVEDQGPGYLLVLRRDSAINELFANGIARCGHTLHPVSEPRLSGREIEDYRRGVSIPREDSVELFTQRLPDLRRRIPVEMKTRRIPRQVHVRPRIQIDTAKENDELVVLPLIVYGEPPIARVDGGKLVLLGDEIPEREEFTEKRLAHHLKRELELLPGHKQHFRGERAVVFADRLNRFQQSAVASSIEGDALDHFFVAGSLQPLLQLLGNDFELSFETEALAGAGREGFQAGAPAFEFGEGFDGEDFDGGGKAPRSLRASPQAVLRAWRSGESLVPLLDGGFAALPRDWMDRFGNRIADLLAAKELAQGELPASALPDLARLCTELGEAPPPAFAELLPIMEDFEELPKAQLEEQLAGILRPYQQRGVDWLSFLRRIKMGALLADDMGLGKTLQAISVLQAPALVVAPTSVLFNWQAELARFAPALKVSLYHGPSRALDPEADVTLTSYALLRLDVDKLTARSWKTVVLDEAHAIKNPDSQVSRAAYQLRSPFRVALTGTPVENRLEELWSQIHFLNPGLLGSRSDFDERYAKPISSGDMEATARLRERIRPFVLRRLKREVAPELPPRSDHILRVEMSESERALYDGVLAATREEVVARLRAGGNVLAALEALLRLRQASCHPGLLPGQKADSSSKVDLLVEALQSAVVEGHKALVFSQWTSLLDLTEPHLKAANIPFTRLDGSTKDRGAVVAEFQAEDGPPVMLLSLKAGGAGLNLTAADHVFLMDPWWNPAVEDQAADRAHRIGQERPVFVHRLVAMGTVEERILALQADKRALAEAALSGTQAAGSLTREDLLALLD